MFDISHFEKIKTSLPLITYGFDILMYDDEPILFHGLNKYGDRVIGSYVDVDESIPCKWYFHVLVTPGTLGNLIEGKLSYRQILETSNPIYLIRETYPEHVMLPKYESYLIGQFDNIPDNYKPTEKSFCKKYDSDPFGKFGGKIHEYFGLSYANFLVLPRVIMESMSNEWQTKMCDLLSELNETFDWLPDDIDLYVQMRKDGKIIKLIPELCNYRHPDEDWLESIKTDESI